MENGTSEYKALKTEICNMKEDIRDIKLDQKETNQFYRDTIFELKENSVRQTEILNNQEKQFQHQFDSLNKDIQSLNDDVGGLRKDMKDTVETNTKWYQEILGDNFGKLIKALIIIVLLLGGLKLTGVDVAKFFGFIGL